MKSITVYTTRPDTLHGATFMVLAPEHASWQENWQRKKQSRQWKITFTDASMRSNIDRMAG